MHTEVSYRFDASENSITFDYHMARVEGNVNHKTFIDYYRAPSVGNLASVCEGVASFGDSPFQPSWIVTYPRVEFPEDLTGAYLYIVMRIGAPYDSTRTSNNIRPAQISARLKHRGKLYSFQSNCHVSMAGEVGSGALASIAIGGHLKKRKCVAAPPSKFVALEP
jgi:hypothetical protein